MEICMRQQVLRHMCPWNLLNHEDKSHLFKLCADFVCRYNVHNLHLLFELILVVIAFLLFQVIQLHYHLVGFLQIKLL
jgi:hypothetical protein